MVLYGENAFWAAGESFHCEAPGQNWREDWAVPNTRARINIIYYIL